MTMSELHCIFTSGFSTVAGSNLAIYKSFGVSTAVLEVDRMFNLSVLRCAIAIKSGECREFLLLGLLLSASSCDLYPLLLIG